MRYIATGQEVFRIDEFTTNVIGIPQLYGIWGKMPIYLVIRGTKK